MSNKRSSDLERLKLWMIYLVISFIVMLASLESTDSESTNADSNDDPSRRKENRKWCIAASIITFALTILILFIHFLTSYPIIGGKLEGASIFFSVVCWCAIVIVASQPRSGVAIAGDNSVDNGNIYYFSWAGFLTSAILMVSWLKTSFQVYVPNELADTRFKYWSTLLASSIVVLGSSADFFSRICDAKSGTVYCDRCILGIVFGSFGTLISIIIVTMNIVGMVPFMMECVLSVLIFILNAFGVAFITSGKGPGAPLGNLYYFSWMSFALVFLIISSCYEDYKLAQEGGFSEGDMALSQAQTMKRANKSGTQLEEEPEEIVEDLEK